MNPVLGAVICLIFFACGWAAGWTERGSHERWKRMKAFWKAEDEARQATLGDNQ